MPELPEVEYAARVARAAVRGRVIATVRVLHASLRRQLGPRAARSLAGERVVDVQRRGKHQLVQLASGRTLHVHFRMTGGWHIGATAEPLPPYTRVVIELDDGTSLVLDDSRALATIAVVEPGIDPLPELGPDAIDPSFTAIALGEALRSRRIAIKPALLDQRIVAGIGNIYASEALWYARVDPRTPAPQLRPPQLAALVTGIRRALVKALDHPERCHGESGRSDAVRFNVYDREGKGCRRCRHPIARTVQAGRSTYFCERCQTPGP